jgi:hypothetical protein
MLRTHESPGIVSPETVYGTVIVAALVFATSSEDSAWDVWWKTVATVVILFAAHAYAEAVAAHGRHGTRVTTLREAIRLGLNQSVGLLYAAIVPAVLLLLGGFGVLSRSLSLNLALWSAVVVLAVLGYFAFRDRGSSILIRVIGGLGTGAFGAIIIVLKTLIH